MNASVKFKNIGSNLNKILYMITTNQNFLRYIKYLDNDPLNPAKSQVTEDDIEGQIVLALFDEEVLEELKVKVFFHPIEGFLETEPLGVDYYIIDIVIPNSFWHLSRQGQFRAFQMAYEIASKIDGKNVAGIGKLKIFKWKNYKVGKTHQGLTLWLEINSVTLTANGM